jgi:hypothetical protein
MDAPFTKSAGSQAVGSYIQSVEGWQGRVTSTTNAADAFAIADDKPIPDAVILSLSADYAGLDEKASKSVEAHLMHLSLKLKPGVAPYDQIARLARYRFPAVFAELPKVAAAVLIGRQDSFPKAEPQIDRTL